MGDHAARCGHCDGPLVVVVDLDSTAINHRLTHLERGQRQILRALNVIHEDEEAIMATVDELAAHFDEYKTSVQQALADLRQAVEEADDDIPPAVQAKIDQLDAAILGADAELPPPAEPTDPGTPDTGPATPDPDVPAEPETPAGPGA